MTTILGPAVKNQSVAYPGSAGELVVNRFEMTVPAGTPTTDIIEIGVIPPNCRVVDAILDLGGALGTTAVADVGVMSGTPGDPSAARTCGAEFFTGVSGTTAAPGTVTRMSALTGFRVNPSPAERGIGFKFTTRTVGTAALVALTVFLATT
jgi:hypothetical protein